MGILSMAWVPRIPEIKKSLGINNGQFGLILLSSSMGSIIGTQIIGRLVHQFGSKTILKYLTCGLPLGIILISLSTHSVIAMVISLFIMSMCLMGHDLTVNVQAVAIEAHLNKRYMSSFHGMWSVGALVTTIIGGVVAHLISPEVNLFAIGVVGLIANLFLLRGVLSNDEDGHEGNDEATGKIPFIGKKYVILWLFGLAFIGALLPEGAVADWSAILLKENMGIGKGLNSTAFGCFAAAMIVSRLTGDKILTRFGPVQTVKLGGYIGGLGLALGIIIGVPLSHHHQVLALIIVNLGFAIAGFGIGPIIPALMVAAAALPDIAPSVALARMGLIGMAGFFIGPTVTGGLAQAFTLPVAMFFPISVLLMAGWLSHLLKD